MKSYVQSKAAELQLCTLPLDGLSGKVRRHRRSLECGTACFLSSSFTDLGRSTAGQSVCRGLETSDRSEAKTKARVRAVSQSCFTELHCRRLSSWRVHKLLLSRDTSRRLRICKVNRRSAYSTSQKRSCAALFNSSSVAARLLAH